MEVSLERPAITTSAPSSKSRLRERANAVVDTTDFKPADLRRTLEENFSPERRPGLAILANP